MAQIKKEDYKIEFVDRILDPVHGFIDLTRVESEIIQLPIFKRLQSLKQLSLTNWVFPGAEHTRYMHSLGVMHIADMMATNLKTVKGEFRFSDGDRQLLRLAGLLHDIGHYPLSHVTEQVYNVEVTEDKDNLYSHNMGVQKRIDALSDEKVDAPDYMKSRYSKPRHHETVGATIINNNSEIKGIISKYCPFVSIKDICDIIVGCADNSEIVAMVQLLHSELDADGIDYVMRDATFSGTSYGGFELGLLLRNLTVTHYEKEEIVGVRPKGISVVDQYLISKYFSYTQVIFNRHVAIFEEMAAKFSKALITLNGTPYPSRDNLVKYAETHDKNENFLKFTDRAFWSQLDKMSDEDMRGLVGEYVLKLRDKLAKYQEFEMSKDGEIIITSNQPEKAAKVLKESDIYKNLQQDSEDRLMLYHEKGFTSQIREEDFRALLSKQFPNDQEKKLEEKFHKYNIKRLQEGIPVIEERKMPKLLADDSRSIMSHLHSTKTYILREYTIN